MLPSDNVSLLSFHEKSLLSDFPEFYMAGIHLFLSVGFIYFSMFVSSFVNCGAFFAYCFRRSCYR